eukprot:8941879-Pyramimonas_sp.AAC.1
MQSTRGTPHESRVAGGTRGGRRSTSQPLKSTSQPLKSTSQQAVVTCGVSSYDFEVTACGTGGRLTLLK